MVNLVVIVIVSANTVCEKPLLIRLTTNIATSTRLPKVSFTDFIVFLHFSVKLTGYGVILY